MAYSELIKSFEKIRDYMREFYIYGFKSREEYNGRHDDPLCQNKRLISSIIIKKIRISIIFHQKYNSLYGTSRGFFLNTE